MLQIFGPRKVVKADQQRCCRRTQPLAELRKCGWSGFLCRLNFEVYNLAAGFRGA